MIDQLKARLNDLQNQLSATTLNDLVNQGTESYLELDDLISHYEIVIKDLEHVQSTKVPDKDVETT